MKLSLTVIATALLLNGATAFILGMSAAATSSNNVVSRKDFLVDVSASASAAAFAITAPAYSYAASLPAVGESAPDFTLPSNTGKDIKLSDFVKNAQHTVLYFYPGDFTSGCTIEAKGFQAHLQDFKALDTQIVGVSVDSLEKHLDFRKSYGLDFPLLSDKDAVVAGLYASQLDIPFMGKFANRLTFIVSKDGKIEKVFTDVEKAVAKHGEQVLEAVKALG